VPWVLVTGNDTDCHGRSLSTVTILIPTTIQFATPRFLHPHATDDSLHQSILVHPLRRQRFTLSLSTEAKQKEVGGKERWIDAILKRKYRFRYVRENTRREKECEGKGR